MDHQILLVVAALIFSGFFSAVEIAFVSANKLHIELQRESGSVIGTILTKFVDSPSYFIATCLLGNTISLVLYGYYFAEILDPTLEKVLLRFYPETAEQSRTVAQLVIQTVLSTLLVLATAEFLPKSISLIDPDKFLQLAAFPINMIYIAFKPAVVMVVGISKWVIYTVFGISQQEGKHAFGLTDLNHYISNIREQPSYAREQAAKEGGSKEIYKEIFSNALEFKTIRVRDCMIPRKEIIAVDHTASIQELSRIFTESGHSKIPVYKDSIDNIIGYCHHLALFKKPTDIKSILTDIIIVPETMLANQLMIRFISEQKSIGLVVDEFGGTSGLVTIEDIMEEIFGNIEDEFDKDDLKIQRIDNNNYLLSARNEVDDLNERFGLNIPEGDYDTLGGYILYINQNIPQIGEVIITPNYQFVIKSMENARIDMVHMTILRKNND
jgi:CBS domain containing-hemolysin-like protein